MIRMLIDIEDLNVLFIGNSNSGKTSLLYAIIREYYGLTKHDRLPENNLLFINNLKEQGIHFFRNEMKTFCQSHSSIHGKKKMIVIDDIDMVNQPNQQVFCNYIDKYKDNVCFVSVCSNIQKIIENIQSRIHILKIHSPDEIHLSEFLNKIVTSEKMTLTEEAKEYILTISNYSIRAVINHLEKIHLFHRHIATESISLETCKTLCTNISPQIFEAYIAYLRKDDIHHAVQLLHEINDFGYSVIDILDYIFSFVKLTETMNENEKYKTIHILCKYITIFHNVHEDTIELSLFTNDLMDVVEKGNP
jgi:DNA polymerase III delta prime subunit